MAIFEVEGGERGVVALKVGTVRLSKPAGCSSKQHRACGVVSPAWIMYAT